MRKTLLLAFASYLLGGFVVTNVAPMHAADAPARVILDTDIGDDIDDAYALALLLKSPEVKILGVTTAFGDTHLRARIVSRMLEDSGNGDIPVFAGPVTEVKKGPSQAPWGLGFPDQPYQDAITFVLDTIRKNPGEITLISVAPLTNIGALIRRDPATFRKLKRVVLMGGSVKRGYGEATGHPEPEWNIVCDIPAAKALFTSGVPLYVMPLDSTQIRFDKNRQKLLFAKGDALANDLQELTHEWTAATTYESPTLYDAVAAAYALQPDLCPTTPMHIVVDDHGMTLQAHGKANANVCLTSNSENFLNFYSSRVDR